MTQETAKLELTKKNPIIPEKAQGVKVLGQPDTSVDPGILTAVEGEKPLLIGVFSLPIAPWLAHIHRQQQRVYYKSNK